MIHQFEVATSGGATSTTSPQKPSPAQKPLPAQKALVALEAGTGGVGKHAERSEKVFKSITAKLGDWKSKHKKPEAGQSSSSNVAAVGLAGELAHAPLCDSEHLVPLLLAMSSSITMRLCSVLIVFCQNHITLIFQTNKLLDMLELEDHVADVPTGNGSEDVVAPPS